MKIANERKRNLSVLEHEKLTACLTNMSKGLTAYYYNEWPETLSAQKFDNEFSHLMSQVYTTAKL